VTVRVRGSDRSAIPRCLIVAVLLATVVGCSAGRTPAEDATGSRSTPAPARAETATPRAGALPDCPPGPGTPVRDLRTTTLRCLAGGAAVPVGVLHGRPLVLNLWASWCAPCRQELPLLASAYRQAGDRVDFLGVDVRDEDGAARGLLATAAPGYPQVADPDGTFARGQGVTGLPATFVVSASGRLLVRHLGPLTAGDLRDGLALAGVTVSLPG
jgi:cytochrome c biogenesis protein CcmG/thiol:disulfide interchange protein DsbE